jgi:hypothetical protein
MGPTLAADAAVHVRGIGAVLEVNPARCCQGAIQLLGPFRVGFGESPNLVGGHAEVADHRAERLAVVDRVEELSQGQAH